MSENDNLQHADGNKETNTNQELENSNTLENVAETKQDATTQEEHANVNETTTSQSHVEEIEQSNAEEAEDDSNSERHALEEKDYHAMSMPQLVAEFEKLLKNYKVQNIKAHVNEIKSEFNAKFNELLEEKKEEFLNDGGNEIDFYYTNNDKKQFNALYKKYKKDLNDYYDNLQKTLKANLAKRLDIIEKIKGLINVEENINTTYKQFKELQEQWRNAGPIPRDKYNNTWNTYHHHVERFYDFLHLNRDLRDMDFKHNLEQKQKIIERAEELAQDDNVNRAFRELQVLHKMWKEDLGPVAKEHREEIWERFSNATKAIHEKRQAYYADLEKAYEANLERKEEIIKHIEAIAEEGANSHQAWQNKIKEIEALREAFFNAGRVPKKSNEATWLKFKTAVRTFNRKKNKFYKDLKKEQYENLQKKMELIKIAEDNQDSTDYETVTPLMKKIQNDWKKIGHVPRKDSDKIWKRFKKACNTYFDRFHEEKREANKELYQAFDEKTKILNELKAFEPSGDSQNDIETIKSKIDSWKNIGEVPQNKRYIESKFKKAIDNAFGKLDMDKSEVEMIKFENKLEVLSNSDDNRSINSEHNFIKKKIDDIKSEINQLENNLQFFSNVDENNPMVKEVLNNIDKHKQNLSIWEEKLKRLKDMF